MLFEATSFLLSGIRTSIQQQGGQPEAEWQPHLFLRRMRRKNTGFKGQNYPAKAANCCKVIVIVFIKFAPRNTTIHMDDKAAAHVG